MTKEDQLKQELHKAILKAAIAMGPNLKSMSWFGRNHRRQSSVANQRVIKKAA